MNGDRRPERTWSSFWNSRSAAAAGGDGEVGGGEVESRRLTATDLPSRRMPRKTAPEPPRPRALAGEKAEVADLRSR